MFGGKQVLVLGYGEVRGKKKYCGLLIYAMKFIFWNIIFNLIFNIIFNLFTYPSQTCHSCENVVMRLSYSNYPVTTLWLVDIY